MVFVRNINVLSRKHLKKGLVKLSIMKNKVYYLVFLLSLSLSIKVLADPVKVGLILPLSGPIADYGATIKNGIQLAQSEKPEEFNNSIEFVYEDARYDAKLAISAFHKLTKSDKVNLVYLFGTTCSAAVAPIAEQNKVPTIILSGEPFITGGKKYIIDFHNRLNDIALATLKELRSRGHSKFAIVKTEVQYLESLVDAFKANLNEKETFTILDSFAPDANPDLKTTVLKVKNGLDKKEFDAIGVFLLTGQISTFFQKMDLYKIKASTFGSDVFGQIEEMKKAGPAAVDGIYATLAVSEEFSNKYYSTYGNRAQLQYAANSYDLANLLLSLFSKYNSKISSDEIIDLIKKSPPTQGALGNYYFTEEDPSKLKNAGNRFIFPIEMRKVSIDGTSLSLSKN